MDNKQLKILISLHSAYISEYLITSGRLPASHITSAALKLLARNIDSALDRDRNKPFDQVVIEHSEQLELELDFLVSEYKDKVK